MVPLAEIAERSQRLQPQHPALHRLLRTRRHPGPRTLTCTAASPIRDIDALSAYWDAFPQLRSLLFKPNRPGYSDLAIDVSEVQQTILDSAEFQKFSADVRGLTDDWFAAHRATLAAISPSTRPNDLIATLGDDLLARFKPVALLDEYDVYEQLMTYWHDTMHDDVFLIMNEGWVDAAKPRKAIEDKDRKLTETPDLVIGSGRSAVKYKTDLIPPALIVARYFADEQAKVDELNATAEEATRAVEEYIEEHAVEDGLLAEAMDDDKITKALAAARLKEAKREGSDPDEIKALQARRRSLRRRERRQEGGQGRTGRARRGDA